ncbi:MAG: type II toxin-antitoxin system HicA family toxin [Elusimicrobia bacterium]|nr:type II toxin-antitoxin system HicA family toxin [Elusimicrobiota bacterium]
MPRIFPVHWRKFEKFVLHLGCRYLRTAGDHIFYSRSDLKRPVVFPKLSDIPVFIIKNNLKTLGISRDAYLKLLEKI